MAISVMLSDFTVAPILEYLYYTKSLIDFNWDVHEDALSSMWNKTGSIEKVNATLTE